MTTAQPDLQQIKERMRAAWMAGDFGKIAEYSRPCAEEFVSRLEVGCGMRVLDVACGTGNLAIPAARAGAQVTGADIATNLIEQARGRAAEEKLKVQFEEGDAEQLPYADASFDLVMSMFGAMFAPRPEVVAAELLRVCRPGGRIAMANWTPEGFVGKSFRVTGRHMPPPANLPAPVLWGDETVVRQRLGPGATKITTAKRFLEFDYPFPPSETVSFFREYFGPTKTAFSRLEAAAQEAMAAELAALWQEHNRSQDGRTQVSAEFLEVVAVK